MKSSKILLLVLVVVLSAGLALADGVPGSDPRIGLGGGGGSEGTSGTFSFTVNDYGGGISPTFYNDTETAFYNLSITAPDPGGDLSTFECDIYYPYYDSCSITRTPGWITIFIYDIWTSTEDDDIAGIPPGGDFRFTLNNDGSWLANGTGGWIPDSTLAGTANVPEPGTITLLVTGLGTLVAKRKLRRRPSS
jgi:hypothetical protein